MVWSWEFMVWSQEGFSTRVDGLIMRVYGLIKQVQGLIMRVHGLIMRVHHLIMIMRVHGLIMIVHGLIMIVHGLAIRVHGLIIRVIMVWSWEFNGLTMRGHDQILILHVLIIVKSCEFMVWWWKFMHGLFTRVGLIKKVHGLIMRVHFLIIWLSCVVKHRMTMVTLGRQHFSPFYFKYIWCGKHIITLLKTLLYIMTFRLYYIMGVLKACFLKCCFLLQRIFNIKIPWTTGKNIKLWRGSLNFYFM